MAELGLREVTCAIYRAGQDKPATRWSFFIRTADTDETLAAFIDRLKNTSGIQSRAEEIGLFRSKIKLSLRRTDPEPDFPKGRLFAMDTEDQFTSMLPLLKKTSNYELIVKVVEIEMKSMNEVLGKRKLNTDNIHQLNEGEEPKEKKPKLIGRPPKNFDERLIIFTNKINDKYPDVRIKSSTLIQCCCKSEIHLHRAFGSSNFNKHIKVCSSRRLKKAATSETVVKLKDFLSRQPSVASPSVDNEANDNQDSDDSLKSGGYESEDCVNEVCNLKLDDDPEIWLCETPLSPVPLFDHISDELDGSQHDTTDIESDVSSLSSPSDYDSDGVPVGNFADEVTSTNRRYCYWDSVCEKLQDLLDSGVLEKDHIFYVYLNSALDFVKQIGNPKSQYQWDERILEFVETLEYHGHQKVLNILRGPGFLGKGKGGVKQFDWKTWNLPLPGRSTRHKNMTGYTTVNGIHANLLKSFIEMCLPEESKVSFIVNNAISKIIPVAIQKDGMALKPGLMVDIRQGLLIGGIIDIDYEFIQKNPNPSSDLLRSLFAQEAEVTCITSLDNKLTIPIGAEYIGKGTTSSETFKKLVLHSNHVQVCLECLKSINTNNGVIVDTNCCSKCEDCLQQGAVCKDCEQQGQLYIEPALRCCTYCIKNNKKCVKLIVLVIATDSESKNSGAKEMFEESKMNSTLDPGISLASCIPDGVHVGKRLARQFSNWFLLIDGYRINRVLLRTLRGDPFLRDKLRLHLTVAACRNRDRMDVDASLEISSKPVRDIISEVHTITHTIIPEKYRLCDDNKLGILSRPISICSMPNGNLLLVDAQKGRLFSIRLHYPVDIEEITGKLKQPISVTYIEGIVFISDLSEKAILFVDLKNNFIYDPERMTVKQLQQALKDKGIWKSQDKSLKKAELQERLQTWINNKQGSLVASNSISGGHGQKVGKMHIRNLDKLEPGAISTIGNNLVASDLECGNIYLLSFSSNGLGIDANVTQIISTSVPFIYSILSTDEKVYFASSDDKYGGIFSIKREADKLVTSVNKLVSNGTETLKKAFGIAVNSEGLLVTDMKDKKVKLLKYSNGQNTLEIYAGVGITGNSDGTQAQFQQPAGICTEQESVFITDIATGNVKLIVRSSPLVNFLKILNIFHAAIGVTLDDNSTEETFEERISLLEDVSKYFNDCTEKIREFTGLSRTLQGPEGACSAQSLSDMKMMTGCMHSVLDIIKKFNSSYEETLSIKSFLTLVVENFFAEMREGNSMPLVLQFCQKFHSCTRELLKRYTKCSFLYFTGDYSYYHREKNSFIEFKNTHGTAIEIPKRKRLSNDHLSILRQWCAEYGQSVRQNTVRNLTTKDKPGTLPLAAYEKDMSTGKDIDIGDLQNSLAKEFTCEKRKETKKKVLLSKKTTTYLRINRRLVVAILLEDLLETVEEVASVSCIMHFQDRMNSLKFVSNGKRTLVSSHDIIGTIDSDDMTLLEDTVFLTPELYETVLLPSDDTSTVQEKVDENEEDEMIIHDVGDNLKRRSKRQKYIRGDPDFIFF